MSLPVAGYFAGNGLFLFLKPGAYHRGRDHTLKLLLQAVFLPKGLRYPYRRASTAPTARTRQMMGYSEDAGEHAALPDISDPSSLDLRPALTFSKCLEMPVFDA